MLSGRRVRRKRRGIVMKCESQPLVHGIVEDTWIHGDTVGPWGYMGIHGSMGIQWVYGDT